MAEISAANLERVLIEDTGDWREKQWEQSKIVFESFKNYLQEKGIKESTVGKKANMAVFFVMEFLFVHCDDIDNMLYVDDYEIRTFLGNWYIRKSLRPTVGEINQFLKSISDFYTFLHKKGFLNKNHLKEIKEVCKDKEWFAGRLKGYFDAEGEDFENWLTDYNYDPF